LSLILGDYTQVLLRKGSTTYEYFETPYCSGSVSFEQTHKEKRRFKNTNTSVITEKKCSLNIDSMLIDATNNKILTWFDDSDIAIIINFYDEDFISQYSETITGIKFNNRNIEWKNKEYISMKFTAGGTWSS
jgi:hypothetical protein